MYRAVRLTSKQTPDPTRCPQLSARIDERRTGVLQRLGRCPGFGGLYGVCGARLGDEVHAQAVERGGGGTRDGARQRSRDEVAWVWQERSQRRGRTLPKRRICVKLLVLLLLPRR